MVKIFAIIFISMLATNALADYKTLDSSMHQVESSKIVLVKEADKKKTVKKIHEDKNGDCIFKMRELVGFKEVLDGLEAPLVNVSYIKADCNTIF